MSTLPAVYTMGYYETGDGATRAVQLARCRTVHGSWALLDAVAAAPEDDDLRVVTSRLEDIEEASDTAETYLDLARTLRRPVDELWT